MMRRRFDSFKVEKETLQTELKAKEDALKTSKERNEEQDRQIQMLKTDIKDREQTIDNKEKRIRCVCLRERERERFCSRVFLCVYVCMPVCVCMYVCVCVCVCVYVYCVTR